MSEAVSSMPSLEEKNVRIAGRTLKLSGLVNDTYFSSINDDFEDSFYRFASKYLSPDSTAIDVGANIGITSLILDRVLCNGRIIAFEPSPTVFPILEKNIGLIESENITLHNLAVGAKEGVMKFRDESAYGYLVREDTMGNESNSFTTVKITKLDKFIVNSNLNRVDFVKIDVEGFEYDVLCGMENIIKQFNPLVYFEFNSWTQIALRNMNPRKLLDFVLSQFKYVYYFDSSNELALLNDNNSIFFLGLRGIVWVNL